MKKVLLPVVLAASAQTNISSMAKIKMMSANMSTPQKVALAAGTSAVVFGVCHVIPKLIKKYQAAVDRKAKAQAAAEAKTKKEQEHQLLANLINGIEENDILLVKSSCDNQVNVNCSIYEGRTPLMLAAEKGNVVIVHILLFHGADCLKENKGKRAVNYAKEQGHSEVEKLLQDAATKQLWSAVNRGSESTVRDAIAAGADIESMNEAGNTPLLQAVNSYDGNMIRTLILAGANSNAKDKNGKTIDEILTQLYEEDEFTSNHLNMIFLTAREDRNVLIWKSLELQRKTEMQLKSSNDAQNADVDQNEDTGSDSSDDAEIEERAVLQEQAAAANALHSSDSESSDDDIPNDGSSSPQSPVFSLFD